MYTLNSIKLLPYVSNTNMIKKTDFDQKEFVCLPKKELFISNLLVQILPSVRAWLIWASKFSLHSETLFLFCEIFFE